ncbi:hypothetical protein J6590_030119 [Homalodisca vitripennis]|nr:hypothetical protein J6590_030119 [Homalodisca vitripennis]
MSAALAQPKAARPVNYAICTAEGPRALDHREAAFHHLSSAAFRRTPSVELASCSSRTLRTSWLWITSSNSCTLRSSLQLHFNKPDQSGGIHVSPGFPYSNYFLTRGVIRGSLTGGLSTGCSSICYPLMVADDEEPVTVSVAGMAAMVHVLFHCLATTSVVFKRHDVVLDHLIAASINLRGVPEPPASSGRYMRRWGLQWRLFTQHGQHLNQLGKRVLSGMIAASARKLRLVSTRRPKPVAELQRMPPPSNPPINQRLPASKRHQVNDRLTLDRQNTILF